MLTGKVILAFVFLGLVDTQDYEYIDAEDYYLNREPQNNDFLDHQNSSSAQPHQPHQHTIWQHIYIVVTKNYLIFTIVTIVALALILITIGTSIFLVRRAKNTKKYTIRRHLTTRQHPVNRDSWFPYLTG